MSWQSWAANELNQVATYPSPYANVHKGNMNTMGGSIGLTCLLKRKNLVRELNVVSVCITMEELSLSCFPKRSATLSCWIMSKR